MFHQQHACQNDFFVLEEDNQGSLNMMGETKRFQFNWWDIMIVRQFQGPTDRFYAIPLSPQSIVQTAKRGVSKHDYTAVHGILPILRYLLSVEKDFDEILQVSIVCWRLHFP